MLGKFKTESRESFEKNKTKRQAKTEDPSGAPETTLSFWWGSCC